MKKQFTDRIALPAGVTARVDGKMVHIKGPKGELTRTVAPNVEVKQENNALVFTNKDATKREKTTFYTSVAHVRNCVNGVLAPYVYKLKIFGSHFPITAAVSGTTFSVKNFLGEKVPRTLTIVQGVKVTVAGADVTVESIDLEKAGMTASALENLTRISDKDRRVFQDGVYITQKPGV